MQSDEEKIRGVIETWMEATKSGDTQKVLDLMTDDAVFLVAGRAPFGKEEFRRAAETQSNSSIKFEGHSDPLEINVLGDWAYVISKLTVTTIQPGKPEIRRSGHTLTIFRREEGEWQLARDANLLSGDNT